MRPFILLPRAGSMNALAQSTLPISGVVACVRHIGHSVSGHLHRETVTGLGRGQDNTFSFISGYSHATDHRTATHCFKKVLRRLSSLRVHGIFQSR